MQTWPRQHIQVIKTIPTPQLLIEIHKTFLNDISIRYHLIVDPKLGDKILLCIK